MLVSFLTRQLDRAKRGVSVGGLGILAKHRKKQHLLILLDSLRTIKTLVRNNKNLYYTCFTGYTCSSGFVVCAKVCPVSVHGYKILHV